MGTLKTTPRTFLVLLLATAWLDAHAQSDLPKCTPTALIDTRSCFGAHEFDDGSIHIGGWRDGVPHGTGSWYSKDNSLIVRGYWQGSDTVVVSENRWQYLSSTDTFRYFALLKSIQQEGAYRRAWTMMAYNKPDKDGWQSVRTLYRFDCANERTKTLAFTAFSMGFGGGKVLASNQGEGDWSYVAPGTAFASVHKFVCRYKLISQKGDIKPRAPDHSRRTSLAKFLSGLPKMKNH